MNATAAQSKPHAPGRDPPGRQGRLMVLSGPPGAGKTTVVTILSRRHDHCVHIQADDFWHFIRSAAIPPYLPQAHEQNAIVIGAIARAAATYAAGGYDVFVDGIIGPWFLERFCTAADYAEIHYLVLRPKQTTTLQRAVHRGPDALTAIEPIQAMYRQFADLGPYERHVIDSTTLDPAATAECVEQALENRQFSLSRVTQCR